MMQSIRGVAKWVMIVVSLAFLSWLVFDLSGVTSGTGSIFASSSVGKINGQSVDIRVFDQRVQNVTQEQQQRGGALGLDQIQEIRDQVWDETVRGVLLQDEYRRRGLTASSDEVAEAIRNVPLPEIQQVATFQTNGQFDLAKYHRWLASAEGQQYVPSLEAQYRDQLLQAKLFRSIVADVFVSDATLWERYRDEKEQVKVGMVRIDPTVNVNEQAGAPTAAEVESYYSQHRDDFKRDRSAYLSFVYVSRATIASDSAAALARAQAARAEIVAGAPFEEVAGRESADSVSGARGGDLGEQTRTGVDKAFGDAVFSLPLNTLSEPVLSQFGYHLIKVESRTGDKFKARHILIPIEVAGAHRDQLDAVADSLENLAAEKLDRAALDTAARALNLPVRKVGPVPEGTRVFVPESGQVPDAGVWAFQAEPGEHSQVIDAPNAFFVFRLDSVTAEGIPPLAAIRKEVEDRVRLQKKTVEARRLAEQVAKQAAAGTALSQAARTMGFEYREIGPFARLTAPLGSPTLIGAAFSLTRGQVAGPISTDDAPGTGDPAVYLLEGIERVPADSAEFAKNLPEIRQQALQAAKRSRVQAYLAAMRESAKIVDRRAEVYRTAAQNAAAAIPTQP